MMQAAQYWGSIRAPVRIECYREMSMGLGMNLVFGLWEIQLLACGSFVLHGARESGASGVSRRLLQHKLSFAGPKLWR